MWLGFFVMCLNLRQLMSGRVVPWAATVFSLVFLLMAWQLAASSYAGTAPAAPGTSTPSATSATATKTAASSQAQAASAVRQVSFYETPFQRRPSVAELTELGRALFAEPALSASGKMSCQSCHSPQHAYSAPNALPVQVGGAKLKSPGLRAVPSIMYQQATPAFNEHFSDNDGDDSADQGPTGGRTWDGRVSSAHDQAALPLLSPLEMANPDSASVVKRLRQSPLAPRFAAVFGAQTLQDSEKSWNGLLWALEVFQQSPSDFYPYSSKYDAVLRGQAQLTAQERRGLDAFNDARRGNCAQCHPSAFKRGAFPAFTDYGHINLGVPRNRHIAANATASWYDLGLCGPMRTDLTTRTDFCGRFKTPSLRNVGLRKSFFHNGVFHSLDDVVRFYAERDSRPQQFYGRSSGGKVQKFDDLPADMHGNVNMEAPFGAAQGGKPALTSAEIRDVVAFLRTLSDGFKTQ